MKHGESKVYRGYEIRASYDSTITGRRCNTLQAYYIIRKVYCSTHRGRDYCTSIKKAEAVIDDWYRIHNQSWHTLRVDAPLKAELVKAWGTNDHIEAVEADQKRAAKLEEARKNQEQKRIAIAEIFRDQGKELYHALKDLDPDHELAKQIEARVTAIATDF